MLKSMIRQSTVPIFLFIALTITVYGQTAADIQNTINQSPEQIRETAAEAGYTEADIDILTEKAREAGVSESDIQKVLEGQEKLQDKKIQEMEEGIEEDQKIEEGEDWVKRGKTDSGIRPFGYNIFNYSPKTFEPYDYAPVDPDYPIGPGDEIIIYLWGDVELSHQLTVSREGEIFIPKVGMIYLNGLTLTQAEKKIRNRMSNVYSGIKKQRVMIDVSLGKIKRIRVYVHGEVVKPGGYNLSSITTVFHALYYAGGPTAKGTLRNIKLIRNNKVTEEIDIYDYLTTGDKKGDIRLENDDILLIPPVGRTVSLQGAVYRPARYELKEGENLKKLLDLAGGLLPESFTVNIHVDRKMPNLGSELVDINLEQLLKLKSNDFTLEDGDVITVPTITTKPANYVNIEGEILMPGEYEIKEGMVVSDLIASAGGLIKSSYLKNVEIARIEAESGKDNPVIFIISLKDGETDKFELRPFDRVYIRKDPEYEMQHNVSINGEVWFPGTYALDINNKEKISDIVARAGGLKEEAFVMGMIFKRPGEGVIDVALETTKNGKNIKGKNDIVMRRGDSIYIPKRPETVQVSGHVFFPANLVWQDGENVEDYIDRAGGYKDNADKGKVMLIYPNGRIKEVKRRFLFLSMSAEVPPGSRIVVPKDESEPIDWRGMFKDITTIASSLAMTIYLIQNLK